MCIIELTVWKYTIFTRWLPESERIVLKIVPGFIAHIRTAVKHEPIRLQVYLKLRMHWCILLASLASSGYMYYRYSRRKRKGCSLWCIHNACLASSMKMSACLLHAFRIPCILGNLLVSSLHPICILCISGCKIAFFLHPFCIHCIHSVETPCIPDLWLHPHFIHNASHASHASPLHLQYILNASNLGMQLWLGITNIFTLTVRGSTLVVRIWRLRTSDSVWTSDSDD